MKKWVDVIHKGTDGILYICRPEKRKIPSAFPKWFCYECNKYVLPDGKKHFSYIGRVN